MDNGNNIENDKKAGTIQNLVLREPENIEEMHSLLKLRYQRYIRIPGQRLTSANSYQIDLDGYDRYARHLGLFHTDASGKIRTVGYQRQITSEPMNNGLIEEIADISRFHYNRAHSERKVILPSLGFFPEFKEYMVKSGIEINNLIEPSRLCLDSRIRSIRAIKLIVLGSTAYALSNGWISGLLTARTLHVPFYRLLGFYSPPGWSARYVPAAGYRLAAMIRWRTCESPVVSRMLKIYRDDFEKYGRISASWGKEVGNPKNIDAFDCAESRHG
jgi:hypothetical protein